VICYCSSTRFTRRFQCLFILECIEETWPESPLLPKDPYEKAFSSLLD